MTNERNMILSSLPVGNLCQLLVPLPSEIGKQKTGPGAGKRVENVRNCDIFLEDNNFYIYTDVFCYKYRSRRRFDTKDIKELLIKYNSKARWYEVELPCLPLSENELASISHAEKNEHNNKAASEDAVDLWKLKRITEFCRLQIDNANEPVKFDANFGYGFASLMRGKLNVGDADVTAISQMPAPHLVSPLKRTIDREIDELKSFSRDQYKMNFVELQVPEGHENPMNYVPRLHDTILTEDEEGVLHNLTRCAEMRMMPAMYHQSEIDCGLIDILLAICYDIRVTGNEPTCESAWTRVILSPTLSYFESFTSIKDVVVAFMRRSLIFPLYRNYELGRLCVEDTFEVLHKSPDWIVKQLLVTHDLLINGDDNREFLNHVYIDDYIRYVHNKDHCGRSHLRLLARNLKNIWLDVNKKHVRLDLGGIEAELLKDLITDISLGDSSASETESEYDDDGEEYDASASNEDDAAAGAKSGGNETDTSSASETEENSVIEQHQDAAKL